MFSLSSFSESSIGAHSAPITVSTDDIAFDGYGLQNSNIIVSDANFEDAGDNEFNTYPLPRRDGTGFLSRFWRKKRITLKGIVKGSTKAEMESRIDEMKKSLSGTEGVLQYSNANGTRKITATLSDAQFDRKHYHVSFCPFSLTFESQDAFWYDASNLWFSASGVTASPDVESLSNSGSAPASPFVVMQFNSASGVTSASFSANSKTVTVTGTFSAGTLIEMDGNSKTVKVNGVETDYSGTFPELLPGANTATFTANGTFNMEIVAVWRKNYL